MWFVPLFGTGATAAQNVMGIARELDKGRASAHTSGAELESYNRRTN